MKNELLMRAIGEIDDEFLEEARKPLSDSRRAFSVAMRYLAAAACIVVVFSTLLIAATQGGVDMTVSVNGAVAVGEKISEKPIEVPLISVYTPRQTGGTEIPLQISVANGTVTAEASEGSTFIDMNGNECTSLELSEDADIAWCIDTAERYSFEITLTTKKQTIRLVAKIDDAGNALIVTAKAD